ncbi:hypothetical protein IF1G_02908 [Cordyceps javanica]|uniref:Uncharacterized protein n=1 Tax=Cordyceps javanica TaxID=43265 RepID=A0A545VAU9_9HYPO|nr:hypothetical protein IF1G_02908 [Cordyceps javanica]
MLRLVIQRMNICMYTDIATLEKGEESAVYITARNYKTFLTTPGFLHLYQGSSVPKVR